MTTHVRCGTLFTARTDKAERDQTLVYGTDGGSPMSARRRAHQAGAERHRARLFSAVRHARAVRQPTHLAYGNAKSEEDIDPYSPLGVRALRGSSSRKKCWRPGVTAICSPGDAGQVSLSIRDAIRAGLFDGRGSARRALHHHAPEPDRTGIRLDRRALDRDRPASDQPRRGASTRSGSRSRTAVDCVKIRAHGIQRRPDGELIGRSIRTRPLRWPRRYAAWAAVGGAWRGREATLYAARAGIDLIFHAFDIDDEGIERC